MKQLDIIKKLKKRLKTIFKYENTGHDISHLERVYNNALEIQKCEGGDLYIVAVSALVHDVHRLMSTQDKRYVAPEESIDKVQQMLLECDVDLKKLDSILDVVRNHDSKNNKSFSLETLIVQDADALDSLGKIGLERTLKYCAANNIPLVSNIPLDSLEYIPDINPISTCHYIYRTMIPNSRNLYTKTARETAKNKVEVLKKFLNKHCLIK